MKSIALFDLDKTIYHTHSYFEIVRNQIDEGLLEEAFWEKVLSEEQKYRTNVQTYSKTATNLMTMWSSVLESKSFEQAANLAEKHFHNNQDKFFPYFAKILPKLKKSHEIYLITMNAQFVANAVVKMFKLDGYVSSIVEVNNGKFTGKALRLLSRGKSLVNELICEENFKDSIACGDSDNDIEMLQAVEHAICINPNEKLKEIALKNKWIITNQEDAANVFYDILKIKQFT